ncbi:hypothetical protein B2J88_50400 [Rhodococcus sp. SRB_17]|uniref:hypothetical protein n=1 Tax=Rhodococcus sp. ARC_M6 TaxID=2928852 RepID=UPI00146AC22A|nr:hypothetical protein [Rhodococcus sp. ARC_M6]MCJ0907407.1 hypothetical protein [Rhodococcus sp. ARC_M6]NMM92361.1 hypothetical protein [Rhodococcus sp. SRB_17]
MRYTPAAERGKFAFLFLPDYLGEQADLTLSLASVLTGTPVVAGSLPVTITADNGVGTPATLTATAALVVDPPATGSLGSVGAIFGS